jgi:formylglycine-generating enzyme required for sulfatase activity
MSAEVRIREPLGERAAALPLVLGGEGAALPVPGMSTHGLTIEGRDGQWLVRPATGAEATLNGMPLVEATTLDAADVIGIGAAQVVVHPERGEIQVHHLAGNDTIAPLHRQALPGDEVVAGVREIVAADSAEAAGVEMADPAARRGSAAGRGRYWLVAAMLVLLAGAGVLFALVAVPLQLEPEGTTIEASGPLDWQAGDRLFLLPGLRELTFTHPGYRSQSLKLRVTRELADAEPLAVTLARLPDHYVIDTGGVAAELFVDGHRVAELPGEVEIEAGIHELIVRAPRFVDNVSMEDVEGGGNRRELKVQLQPATGWLVLDSTPANARVTIDGKDAGNAPLRLELDAGLRKLSLAAPGRRRWNSEVAIIAGQTLDLGRIDLAVPPPPEPRVAAGPAKPETSATPGNEDSESAAPAVRAQPPAPRLTSALIGTLVLLPAGKYLQGSERREQGRRSNEVQREVTLTRAFYLAEDEVTNAQFRTFKADHMSGIAKDKSLDLDQQAVTNVSWDDAVEFCNWLSLREGLPAAYERRDGRWQLIEPYDTGYRLPTEAEWEYAARYVDGRKWQRYPWGDALPPPQGAANLGGAESLPTKNGPDARLASSLPGYRDDHPVVAPVGAYARSAAGFRDLAGNVSEWMHDVYISLPDSRPVTDPMGATRDGPHAVRGANWQTSSIAELRPAWRDQASAPSQVLGFRVARFAEDAK